MIPALLITGSILLLTAAASLATRLVPFRVCALCVGVAGTWGGLLALRASGVPLDPVLPAVLMGGSVVGIAYVLERRLPHGRSPLAWKATFIPIGFLAAHAVFAAPVLSIPLAAVAAVTAYAFHRPPRTGNGAVTSIEHDLTHCC